jgi:diguanylate cyclase (GGDEF)-like protein
LFSIVVVILILSAALYSHTRQGVDEDVIRVRASAQHFYEESIRYDARALSAVMHALSVDDSLNAALARRDRHELLRLAAPLFAQLKSDFSITHFYFTGTDRVNLLRVHAPMRYGDVIDRITTLAAERSGTIAHGVELGPLGTFTLRLVAPWFDRDTQQLIGYVELGMEIDQVVEKLQFLAGVQLVTLIQKSFLERQRWEAGMRALGRTPNWERFPDVVTTEQATHAIPTQVLKKITASKFDNVRSMVELVYRDASYRVTALPLLDAGGRPVAHMMLLADVSEEEGAARRVFHYGALAMGLAGGTLLVFFYWLVGRVGSRIECDEKALEDLATHDGLTHLYNHRTCYKFLKEELARAQRHRTSVSLLMLDIDHFKDVNDNHGHPAGDAILRGLSELLVSRMRNIDRVCRYGGEEMAIILPGTCEDVLVPAERLRAAIEQQPFEIDSGEQLAITVSIGVATFPDDAERVDALVSAADSALYAAKQGGRNQVIVFKDTLGERA